ncbi:MAG TPA: DNA (cytosine-5-)-methyltransferase [Chitinophagales bacterium]|nr:DNA (cytosine-5-)-methyltransferase [Chitinophagales bacterium]
MPIPVIDIFAGPGGLGEGFSALTDKSGEQKFRIALSIEKETFAHETLTLRSFFRQFKRNQVPDAYYEFVKGNITKDKLYQLHPNQAKAAHEEAWQATLGETPDSEIDGRIAKALKGSKNWLLVGGPPCQAYSVVGRSRRKEKVLDESKDVRVGLYKQYLRILAVHNPAVFVMENVKGILSASTKDDSVFSKIREDLSDPVKAYIAEYGKPVTKLNCPGYRIYSLVTMPNGYDTNGNPDYKPGDFVIRAEEFGIPQARHRVILLGVRKDIDTTPGVLKQTDEVPISKVLDGLPRLRSGLSKSEDTGTHWLEVMHKIVSSNLLRGADAEVLDKINTSINNIKLPRYDIGREYIDKADLSVGYRQDWFIDQRLGGVCNHTSRGHMELDLYRYIFVASYAKVHRLSPKLENFPKGILPKHENVTEGIENKKFADRFRVQLWDKPAKTITSHISKDGHYYIYPDPTQCRSFTVREAARIQTFPDNYFFCGTRTFQFHQVGNAVPPLLANQIAEIVHKIIL